MHSSMVYEDMKHRGTCHDTPSDMDLREQSFEFTLTCIRCVNRFTVFSSVNVLTQLVAAG